MNTLAQTNENALAIATEKELAEADAFGQIVEQCQNSLDGSNKFTRAVLTAKAIAALEKAMTPSIMKDFMGLMNSPLGFKTDRYDGMKDRSGNVVKAYSESVVKRCLIVGILQGANVFGNEINIIAHNCYLTKEFFDRKIRQHAGIQSFSYQIGPPAKHGDKSAILEATAEWIDQHGELHSVEFVDKRRDDPPGRDMRIVVNAYASSSPDELRGKAESKLFRRCFHQITGQELMEPMTVEGSATPVNQDPAKIESKNEVELSEGQYGFIDTVEADLSEAGAQVAVDKIARERTADVNRSDWTEDAKHKAVDMIEELRVARIEQMKASSK